MNQEFDIEFADYDEEELEFLQEAGATKDPKDYYFNVIETSDSVTPLFAVIVPKKFWDDNGYLFDGHLTREAGGLLALDPEYGELAEANIEPNTPMTRIQMEQDLKRRGFVHNPQVG